MPAATRIARATKATRPLAIAAVCCAAVLAQAGPVVLDPYARLSLFDHGGVLDYANSGGHVGAVEVSENGGVFVVIDSPSLGVLTTSLQLVRSTGMDSAEFVGGAHPIVIMPWASDLTFGPGGLLYVAGAMNGVGGIFGLDPAGNLTPQSYASGTCAFSTTGLTFAADGSHALVSTDGSQTSCNNGLYRVWPDGTNEHLIMQLEVPDGIPRGADDHAVMLDGRVILAGDKSHLLWDATDGAGAVQVALELDALFTPTDIPGWAGGNPVFGSRIAVDPVSGDLFYTHGTGAPDKTMSIVRISSDFSSASIFAEGFGILRDLDFGQAGNGNERSLYVVELSREGPVPGNGDTGAIYEISFPQDQDADGLPDFADNCILDPNTGQRDTDGDGFGNLCDADLNNDLVINTVDLGLLKAAFFQTGDLASDFDGDGQVNGVDLGILRASFFAQPGPSGVYDNAGVERRETLQTP